MDTDTLLAERVRALRKTRGLTLDQLAELSGVSRSMISAIERQQTSPTAAVLNKLADALGLTLPALFADATPAAEPLARHANQPVWTDPASGYVRRQLSPSGFPSPLELVEVEFPAGQSVVFDHPLRRLGIHQQLWMLQGALDIRAGDQHWQLRAGDCLAMQLAAQVAFSNPYPQPARYLLALTTSET
ncbi:helix-turn-helix domain-containing protein [Duganella sp. FT80W]|uniref:Helix-turn-helix domain-containing protein n=1 Tax=Duganella guangzhouensis TaxID=2666084 RepID=A0A6I2L9M5_9BURK|nr:XRE family transcriptional regulator [Duganella guangzhouensis]MRW93887.1 helix-turn-helix domain-containing protein [Duganella guangzhouensis]